MVDIDGVLSLFGAPGPSATANSGPGEVDSMDGSLHAIDGILHFLSRSAAAHLLAVAGLYDLVWASGWEEKADEYLPHLLGLPASLPYLRFPQPDPTSRAKRAHWKLDAIDAYAGGRALAWIDDAFNPACHAWARGRAAPTLLVATLPAQGLTATQAGLLRSWALALA